MNIYKWCEHYLLDVVIDNNILTLNNDKFFIVKAKEINGQQLLFDKNFKLILSDAEVNEIIEAKANNFLFEFGGNWYYSQIDENIEFNLNDFRHIGISTNYDDRLPFLGIHGKYEILNGTRDYNDWCNKAKFLGYRTLGICELNTLAGVISFHNACKEANIKYVIGETIKICIDRNKYIYAKLYVKNDIGWQNLLQINTKINVDYKEEDNKFIDISELFNFSDGLICVLCSNTIFNKNLFLRFKRKFDDFYFQIDTVEFISNEQDKEHLLNLKNYYDNFRNLISPILLNDAYYLDKHDYESKIILNKVLGQRMGYASKDQYFKSTKQIIDQLKRLTKDTKFIDICLKNSIDVVKQCEFEIVTNNKYLPQYTMKNDESKLYTSNEELFLTLIENSFKEKIKNNVEVYLERLTGEIKLIKKAKIIDYFLILWDLVSWCKENNILIGAGRGSAAGSLISYLLGITYVDPIRFNLLFERFISEARLRSELPDIDIDFQASKREQVKNYLIERYGFNRVASIGTYINLKLKSAIKDLAKQFNIPFSESNFITSIISKEYDNSKFIDLFKLIAKDSKVKTFIKNNKQLFNILKLSLFSPKTTSIHAAAMVITPIEEKRKNIYDYLPVRKINNKLVTEWEGVDLMNMGYLKEDILGLTQLDKFRNILDLIKINTNNSIDLYNLPLDDQQIFEYFKLGYTEDIFQFGTHGLKKYCKDLKPDNIEELIAANALYRPGVMESGAHIDYVKLKHGKMKVQYDPFLENITNITYGLYVYQEQVMLAFNKITNSTLEEADEFRKLISKLNKEDFSKKESQNKVYKYKKLFISKYEEKGVTKQKAKVIWDKLLAFSTYGFNKSHATSYSLMGYYSMYLKYSYPIEFYTIALQYAAHEEMPNIMREIELIGNIKLRQPNINYSTTNFFTDYNNKIIYWSLLSIHSLGVKAVSSIMKEREKGKFFSLEEFIERMKKQRINKTMITNMILCGCFDDIEHIVDASDRYKLLKQYCTNNKYLIDKNIELNKDILYFFKVKQKELCGIGFIDYATIISNSRMFKNKTYYEPSYLLQTATEDESCIAIGLISDIVTRKTKKGDKFCIVTLNNNNYNIKCILWPETYNIFENKLKNIQNNIIILNGNIKYSKFDESNIIQSNVFTDIEIL